MSLAWSHSAGYKANAENSVIMGIGEESPSTSPVQLSGSLLECKPLFQSLCFWSLVSMHEKSLKMGKTKNDILQIQ